MPRQPGAPGTGMGRQEQCNHRENLAGVGSAGPTAAAGNAEETPLPEGKNTDIRSFFTVLGYFANKTWTSKVEILLPPWLLAREAGFYIIL